MLEAAVRNGAKQLRLQQEVAESSGVNANITALRLVCGSSGYCEVTFLCSTVGLGCSCGRRGLVGLQLLVGVVNEIFLVRHLEFVRDWLREQSKNSVAVDGQRALVIVWYGFDRGMEKKFKLIEEVQRNTYCRAFNMG